MTNQDRLRTHPEDRFDRVEHVFDLRAVAKSLADESLPTTTGHRQKTLYKQGRVTIALFRFERDSGLPGHSAKGVVTINVLEGKLRVNAEGHEHELPAGQMLILASNVPHDVLALETSTVLLQVHLDEPTSA